ncbi:hypothetical protein AGLY_002736 [Aphis glycines]|uniref:BHLH domain-containing protein n=1 Tax=Aphis glycines TaxID=307491 RepID=A0A6G0U153_APHGL|nr:hypothetical protein AGLY_002736 [Aphis glycines]
MTCGPSRPPLPSRIRTRGPTITWATATRPPSTCGAWSCPAGAVRPITRIPSPYQPPTTAAATAEPPHWGYGPWGSMPAPPPTSRHHQQGVKRHFNESDDCDDAFSEESSKDHCSSPGDGTDTPHMLTRKKRRGIIEKRRRDRINTSLSELRRLVPTAYEKQGSAKLEKAEILQLTVDHLKMIHAKVINNVVCFFFSFRSRHVGLRSVQVRDGLPQHRVQGMRQRGGQVLGVGGGNERPGPAARAAAVALAVLCGAARVRGQVAGRRGTPQRTTAAAARLVRWSSRWSAAPPPPPPPPTLPPAHHYPSTTSPHQQQQQPPSLTLPPPPPPPSHNNNNYETSATAADGIKAAAEADATGLTTLSSVPADYHHHHHHHQQQRQHEQQHHHRGRDDYQHQHQHGGGAGNQLHNLQPVQPAPQPPSGYHDDAAMHQQHHHQQQQQYQSDTSVSAQMKPYRPWGAEVAY